MRLALQALQVDAHLRGVLVAKIAVFFERFVDDVFELRREIGIQPQRRRRITIKNRLEGDARAFATEGKCAGRHFVKHRAEGEEVCTRVDVPGVVR